MSENSLDKSDSLNLIRLCRLCKTNKLVVQFSNRVDKRDGKFYRNSRCRSCENEVTKKNRLKNIEKYRECHRNSQRRQNLKKLMISPSDYASMVEAQGNVCALCGNVETAKKNGRIIVLSVDHDHSTGQVRELLCSRCNILRLGADYLDKHA